VRRKVLERRPGDSPLLVRPLSTRIGEYLAQALGVLRPQVPVGGQLLFDQWD